MAATTQMKKHGRTYEIQYYLALKKNAIILSTRKLMGLDWISVQAELERGE